mmetsp:Transcript_21519/g.72671  ORF Transcript_21519/g.72671 Transcript_21519/m.72671 type:complete len:245 (+) Transcript_21519:42-776(+)
MLKLLIEVPSYSDEGGHTRYKVVTAAATEGAAPTVAFRRFSEFEKLHAALGIAVPFPVAKTYGIKGASEATKRERRHKLQEYLRQTAAAFPADNPPQALLTFLGFKQTTGAARRASTGGTVAAAASEECNERRDSDGYFLSGAGLAQFAAAVPTEPHEALREGIKQGDAFLCQELLANKADPNHADRQGNLPLHLACIFNRCDIALALIDAGADPARANGSGELPSKLAPVSLRMKVPALVPPA